MRSTAPHIPQSKASIEAAPKEAASREAASKEEVSKEAASKEALLLRAKRPGSERRFKGSGRGGREKYCDLSPGPGIQGVSADLRVEGGGDAHPDPARMFPVPVRELPGPSPRDPGPGPSAPLNRSGSSRTGGAVEVKYCYRLTSKTKDPPYGNSHFLKTGFGPPFLP